MAGIVSAPDGWQQMVRDAIATVSRPINVDPRFSPRVTARGAADTANDRGSSPPARAAATLLLLYPAADGSGLVAPITIRHDGLRTHAGEVSLPGGAVDASDADRAATALREAAEEIGLDSVAAGVTVAGALDPIWIPVSSFELLPVVATAARAPHLIPQESEVASIVELPLARLFETDAIGLETFIVREWRLEAAAYRHADLRVWGATARTLAMLATVLSEAGLV
jgi:8-oxo-dGTP pyrophosphatase MutT (NUDIX family)